MITRCDSNRIHDSLHIRQHPFPFVTIEIVKRSSTNERRNESEYFIRPSKKRTLRVVTLEDKLNVVQVDDSNSNIHHHHQLQSNFNRRTGMHLPNPFYPSIITVILLLLLHLTSAILSLHHPQRAIKYHQQQGRISHAFFHEFRRKNGQQLLLHKYSYRQSRYHRIPETLAPAATPTTSVTIESITNTIHDTSKVRTDAESHSIIKHSSPLTPTTVTSGVDKGDPVLEIETSIGTKVAVTPYYASIREQSSLPVTLNDSILPVVDDDDKVNHLPQSLDAIINGMPPESSTSTESKRFSFFRLRLWWRRIQGRKQDGALSTPAITFRSIWRHRHARSAEEGIRREFATQEGLPQLSDFEKNTHNDVGNIVATNGKRMDVLGDATVSMKMSNRRTARQLSSIFAKANASIERTSRRVAARTLTGLITAMAEEVQDLNVEVDARDETPYRNKHITAVRIQFSRLGFKPLRLGGHNSPTDRKQQREAVTNHHFILMDQFRFDKRSVSKNSRNMHVGLLNGRDSNDENDDDFLDRIDADEAFDRIDVDKSGFLDRKELIQALGLAAMVSNDKTLVLEDMESDSHVSILEELASDLFELYDVNGDGVVDRREYKMMVADMAALRNRDQKRRRESEPDGDSDDNHEHINWFFSSIGSIQNRTAATIAPSVDYFQNKLGHFMPSMEYVQNRSGLLSSGVSTSVKFIQNKTGLLTTGVSAGVGYGVEYVQNTTGYLASTSIDFLQNNTGFTEYMQNSSELLTNSMEFVKGRLPWPTEQVPVSAAYSANQVIDNLEAAESFSKSLGSITFSDIKMDLRRLFFGGIPILKHIIPGGPLILEPFTTTITGSFNRRDIMNSFLLDAGLRRLVMRALRRRVGFLRDALEGAMFKGRSWKTFGDETGGGPRVEIPELTNVEFDENDKLIITGSARVQTSPDAAVINQSFKVRTSIGTRKDGRFIRLEEPELALVIECPDSWEKK